MMEISRTGPQGSVYRRGEKIIQRRVGEGTQDWETVNEDLHETTRREIAGGNIWKYEAGK